MQVRHPRVGRIMRTSIRREGRREKNLSWPASASGSIAVRDVLTGFLLAWARRAPQEVLHSCHTRL